MKAVNLHATAKGDFTLASSLSPEEAIALRNQLSTNEILEELSDEAREAVLEAYDRLPATKHFSNLGHAQLPKAHRHLPTATRAGVGWHRVLALGRWLLS